MQEFFEKLVSDSQEAYRAALHAVGQAEDGAHLAGNASQDPDRPRKVTLVLSDMGLPRIPGVGRAVHSSVMIDLIEYEFAGNGIRRSNGPKSHERFGGKPEFIEMGYTSKGGRHLMAKLGNTFPAGTYDLLRKNCNTFSDCALFYLVGQRMQDEHRALEKIGNTLNKYTNIVSSIFSGYEPNPKADNFQTMGVIDHIQKRRQGQMKDPALRV